MNKEQSLVFIGLVIGTDVKWQLGRMTLHTIFKKSLASAWKIMLLSICILFVLVLLGVKLTAAALLGILLMHIWSVGLAPFYILG